MAKKSAEHKLETIFGSPRLRPRLRLRHSRPRYAYDSQLRECNVGLDWWLSGACFFRFVFRRHEPHRTAQHRPIRDPRTNPNLPFKAERVMHLGRLSPTRRRDLRLWATRRAVLNGAANSRRSAAVETRRDVRARLELLALRLASRADEPSSARHCMTCSLEVSKSRVASSLAA